MARSFLDTLRRMQFGASPQFPAALQRLIAKPKTARRYRLNDPVVHLGYVFESMVDEHFTVAAAGLDPRSLLNGPGSVTWIEWTLPDRHKDALSARSVLVGMEVPKALGVVLWQDGDRVLGRSARWTGSHFEMSSEMALDVGGRVTLSLPHETQGPDRMRLIYGLMALLRCEEVCRVAPDLSGDRVVSLRAPWEQVSDAGLPPVRSLAVGDRLGDRLVDYLTDTLNAHRIGIQSPLDDRRRRAALDFADLMREAVMEAEHLVLSPLVLDTATAMLQDDATEASAQVATLPYALTAVEWTGGGPAIGLRGDDTTRWLLLLNASTDDPRGAAVGMLFGTSSSLDDGNGFTFAGSMTLSIGADADDHHDDAFAFDFSGVWLLGFLNRRQSMEIADPYVNVNRFGAFLVNLLALLAMPKATRAMAPKHSEVWEARDRSRKRSGHAPLLGFKEVRLVVDVDGQEQVLAELPAAPAGARSREGGTAFHSVRGHLRTRPATGEREIWVRPHFRGDVRLASLRREVQPAAADVDRSPCERANGCAPQDADRGSPVTICSIEPGAPFSESLPRRIEAHEDDKKRAGASRWTPMSAFVFVRPIATPPATPSLSCVGRGRAAGKGQHGVTVVTAQAAARCAAL